MRAGRPETMPLTRHPPGFVRAFPTSGTERLPLPVRLRARPRPRRSGRHGRPPRRRPRAHRTARPCPSRRGSRAFAARGTRRARTAAAAFVAFESSMKSTPSITATSSIRCSTPGKVSSARPIGSSGTPIALRRRSRQRRSRGCGRRGSAAPPEAGHRRRTPPGERGQGLRRTRGGAPPRRLRAGARTPRAWRPDRRRSRHAGRGGRAPGS